MVGVTTYLIFIKEEAGNRMLVTSKKIHNFIEHSTAYS